MIYGGMLFLGIILYVIFGMEVFDAVCHAMSAISTAGFTTQPAGIAQYASLPIEIVTMILMIVGATNFAVLLLLAEGKPRQALRVTETRFMLLLIAIFTALMAVTFAALMSMGIGDSIRHAFFGVTAAFSSTGYSLTDYAKWPPFALGLLMLLMIIGGGAGSTAGGIKLSRAYLLLRITKENIRHRVSPAIKTAAPSYNTARGKTPIDNTLVSDTLGFIACYIGIFILGTLALTLTAGCSLMDAMFEFASALGTVGITNGITGADTGAGTLIVEMIGMTLGRLEIFVVFFGISAGVGMIRKRIKR
jgi:trk system potassium uptake protein TrkH